MKAVVLSFYHPDLVKGGSQQVAINLHRTLLKTGHDSIFIGADNNVPETLRSEATPVTKLAGRKNEYVCQINNFSSQFMTTNDPWSSKGLFNIIMQSKPDVIYMHHFLMIGLDLIIFLKIVLPKTRFIFTAHEFLSVCMRDGHIIKVDGTICHSHTPTDCIKCFPKVNSNTFVIRNEIFEKFYSQFDFIVTPSKFMHEHLSKTYISIKSRLRCIPNGSYTSSEIKKYTSIKRIQNQKINVGFFGQILADKGVYELLSAVEKLHFTGMKFDVDFWGGNFDLNPVDFKNKFNEKILNMSNQESNKIVMQGEYKNNEVIDIMRKYKVLVFPSQWPETFSLVMSEALLSGSIIVVPNIGAFKERSKLYKDRVVTYELENKNGIFDALQIALNKNFLGSENRIIEDLSLENMTANYISLL